MPGSYQRINYALRPAKSIERKMLCEGFARLYPFQRVEQYAYVGLGALYFSDCALVHRQLGITDVLSIEKDEHNASRFEHNVPFCCVKMRFGPSGGILPTLDWRQRKIVWLDYDERLNTVALSDIATVAARACSGTMLVVTVNAHPDAQPSEAVRRQFEKDSQRAFDVDAYRLSILKEEFSDRLPNDVTGADLRGQSFAKVLHRLVRNEFNEVLRTRNLELREEEKIGFEQVFHFTYQDGARMLTIGGVFVAHGDHGRFQACKFDTLPFSRAGNASCDIEVPCLTPREVRFLNTHLPALDTAAIERRGVPLADIERYSAVYRYFPAYTEVLFA